MSNTDSYVTVTQLTGTPEEAQRNKESLEMVCSQICSRIAGKPVKTTITKAEKPNTAQEILNERKCKPMDHKVILACIIVELLVIAVGLIIKAKNDKELKEMYQKAYNDSLNELDHLYDMVDDAQNKLAKEIEEHNEHIKYYEALLHMQKEVCDERLREAGYETDDEDEEEY